MRTREGAELLPDSPPGKLDVVLVRVTWMVWGEEPLPLRRPAFPCWDKSHWQCKVQIRMNHDNAEALSIFLLEGLVVDLVRGTQMGRVGERRPPGILASLSRNNSHWRWRQKFMGTGGGGCGRTADCFVGGTELGFSKGDTEGMQGDATATAESHLPVLGQELPAMREKTHGKPLGRGSSANFVSANARREDGNASTAPIHHSHWGPVPLAAMAQKKMD
jgi:hypothetical protein